MDHKYRTSLIIQITFIWTTLFSVYAQEDDPGYCMKTGWELSIPKCDSGLEEIYHQHNKTSGLYLTVCCVTDSGAAKDQKIHIGECTGSPCVSISTANISNDLCEFMPTRSVNGKEIIFVETVRDSCKMDTSEVGMEAVCCQKDSVDVLSTTLLGTEFHEFPHFARLDGCGGTLYNERYVLTASHCVTDGETQKIDEPQGKIVKFNVLIDDAYTEDTYNVEKVIVHPNSSRLRPPDKNHRLYNDMALLKLDRDVKFGPNVKALPIPPKGFDPFKYSKRAILVGFGVDDALQGSKKQQKANALLRADDHVPDHAMKPFKDQVLYIGGITSNDVSATGGPGDSGGPAICRDENGFAVLCGITSYGMASSELCEKNWDSQHCLPGAYAEVAFFRDWIESVAGDQSRAQVLRQPIYGAKVPKGRYKHQVRITTDAGKSCGGTLIQPDVVVTAAHCVANDDGSLRDDIKVTSGLRDLKRSKGKTWDAVEVFIAEGFQPSLNKMKRLSRRKRLMDVGRKKNKNRVIMTDNYYKNNLAMIRFNGSVNIDHSHLPVLASSKEKDMPNRAVEVAFARDANYSGALSQRDFNLLHKDNCQRRIDRLSSVGIKITIEDNIICGVESYSGGSLCDRELGGGLICEEKNGQDVLCGVQTFRLCEFNVPNAFVNVGKFRDWIQKNI